jgi:hypothetical protein
MPKLFAALEKLQNFGKAPFPNVFKEMRRPNSGRRPNFFKKAGRMPHYSF